MKFDVMSLEKFKFFRDGALPTAKTNTRDVLSICKDKFGHIVSWNRSLCITVLQILFTGIVLLFSLIFNSKFLLSIAFN